MNPISKPPIFRHYQLTIDARDRAAFVAGGTANLLTSLRTEPGTLAMFATHADSAGTRNEVFELYQDEASYQIHAQSPQFKRYGQLAQQVVRKHQMAELKPQVLVSTSVGVSSLACDDQTDNDFYNRVDQNLYHSKRNGRMQITTA